MKRIIDVIYSLTFLTVISAISASASDVVDFGEIVPGEIYEYSDRTPVKGVFTSAENCVLRCYSSGDVIAPYKEESHENPVEPSEAFYGPSGEKVRIYSISAGETFYFYNGFPIDAGTFRLENTKEAIELSGTVPAAGAGNLSLSENYRLTLFFNVQVKVSKVKLEAGSMSEEIPVQINASTVTVSWYDTLLEWYRSGVISEGDELTVTLTGIRDEYDSSNRPDFGDGIGKLVLKFTMAGKPAELVEEVNTPESGMPDFLTYYMPGSEDGLVSLIFDKELDSGCNPVVQLQYGDVENLDFGIYTENLPYRIEDNMITVDLQGVSRLPEQMIPGLPEQKSIYLTISQIKTIDGQYVLTGNMASPYSFGFNYNLKSVVYSIAADWTPLPNSPLASGDDMEIWVLNGGKIMFDSVDFEYQQGGAAAKASVPFDSLNPEEDPTYSDAIIFTLKAPEMKADPGSDIVVTFGNIRCADGLDHSTDIYVVYTAASSSVGSVEMDVCDGIRYDLNGRKASSATKGIIIIDGRKILNY